MLTARETYNAALQERRDAYRMAGISLGYAHQCAELPACKEVRPELAEVNSQVLQDVLKRVDRAFDDFFRRVRGGQQPGYPRFRSRLRYTSLTFKQYHNSFDIHTGKKQEGTLVLSKLGHLKMVMHRPLTGIRHPGHGETDADGQMGCRASAWKVSWRLMPCLHRRRRSASMSA